MKTNWSDYQREIFRFVEEEKGSLVVNAVAGSGKTTTIVECARRAKSNDVLFLAFNKSIVNELQSRMPGVVCSTLHACGLSAIRRAFAKFNVDKSGCYWYERIKAFIHNEIGDSHELSGLSRDAVKLFNLCRLELLKHSDKEGVIAVADHHNIDVCEVVLDAVLYALSTAYEIRFVGQTAQVDFTDMIVLPNINPTVKRYVTKHSLVFIDEAQDLSKAQRGLMLLSVAESGRFVAVGDPRQAINGFAGANNDSFNQLALLADKELPLSCNYRCGSDIIAMAQDIVPNIVAHKGASKGIIRNVNNLKDATIGDMILCRKSAPLVRVALKFLANNVRARVMGKDIACGLASMVKKTKVSRIDTLMDKLDDQIKKAEMLHLINAKEMSVVKLEALKDKVNAIEAIAENIDHKANNGVSMLLDKIEFLFSDNGDKKSQITLATCHKSKGLENERVFILLPEKLPLVWKGQKDWQYEQEMNLKYVAITRAKNELVWVNVEEDNLATIEVK